MTSPFMDEGPIANNKKGILNREFLKRLSGKKLLARYVISQTTGEVGVPHKHTVVRKGPDIHQSIDV